MHVPTVVNGQSITQTTMYNHDGCTGSSRLALRLIHKTGDDQQRSIESSCSPHAIPICIRDYYSHVEYVVFCSVLSWHATDRPLPAAARGLYKNGRADCRADLDPRLRGLTRSGRPSFLPSSSRAPESERISRNPLARGARAEQSSSAGGAANLEPYEYDRAWPSVAARAYLRRPQLGPYSVMLWGLGRGAVRAGGWMARIVSPAADFIGLFFTAKLCRVEEEDACAGAPAQVARFVYSLALAAL